MMLVPGEGGKLTVAARDFPTNKGGMCRKGWTAASLLDAPDRLTTPLASHEKGGKLRPVSWDEALDRIALAASARSRRCTAGMRRCPAGMRWACSAAAG